MNRQQNNIMGEGRGGGGDEQVRLSLYVDQIKFGDFIYIFSMKTINDTRSTFAIVSQLL